MSFHFSYLMKMNFRLIPSPPVQIILIPAAYGLSFLEEFPIPSPELQLACQTGIQTINETWAQHPLLTHWGDVELGCHQRHGHNWFISLGYG
jgi:hypothetical protein